MVSREYGKIFYRDFLGILFADSQKRTSKLCHAEVLRTVLQCVEAEP